LRYHPGAEFKTGVQTGISHINYCGYVKIPARWLSRPLTSPKTSAKGCFDCLKGEILTSFALAAKLAYGNARAPKQALRRANHR
jgi:hypothetical protein